MRDYKSSLLILLSVLLLISAGLFFTALYHFYYKMPVPVPLAKGISKDTAITTERTHDSLLKIYTTAIHDLDKGFDSTWFHADSLKTNLDIKLSEFYKLRSEIKAILTDRSSNADLEIAGEKIVEMQERIAALRYTNLDVEKENKRLNALLSQLTVNEKVEKPITSSAIIESRSVPKGASGSDVFTLSELRFSAIQIDDNRELETNKTEQTEKLLGSFKVRNKNFQNSNAEIMVVVLQPDGRVLQNSPWETGTFETPEGKKIYSTKLRFDYNQGEAKQLLFSLTADKFQQGNYILNIYQNGRLIGKMVKTLS